jgi:hypothetical protein
MPMKTNSHEKAVRVLNKLTKHQLLTLLNAGGCKVSHYQSLPKSASLDAAMSLLTHGHSFHKPRLEIELRSNVRPRDAATQPYRVVLHKDFKGDWVVHLENVVEVAIVKEAKNISECGKYSSKAIPDYYHGHYFDKHYKDAVTCYHDKCKKYGV